MKQLLYLPLLLWVLPVTLKAQSKDKKHIENLCGCFEVEFKYAETFSPVKGYQYHDREHMYATELVLPVAVSNNKYVLQHLLIMDDSVIIKHWREDWAYESPVLFTFQGNKQWNKQTFPATAVKNKWTQSIWEVDDAPRYQGIGEWMVNDGKVYWESTVDAPLPRREYTTRNDYNILRRGNRIVVAADKWIHEQDNQKIRRTSGKDTLVAEEKGINAYTRVADSKCAAGKKWWDKNGKFWDVVRTEWEANINAIGTIDLQSKVEDKRLSQYLDDLQKQWSQNNLSTQEVSTQLNAVIRKFVTAPAAVSSNR